MVWSRMLGSFWHLVATYSVSGCDIMFLNPFELCLLLFAMQTS